VVQHRVNVEHGDRVERGE